MIPRIDKPGHAPEWQTELATAVSSLDTLFDLLQIDAAQRRNSAIDADFPLRVPHSFIARMEKGNIHDPLLRQILPLQAESEHAPGFLADPLLEQQAMAAPGLLHKYSRRALLTVTGACAVHCRYCFRRHFPYTAANPLAVHWEEALNYLHNHNEITEIILSGGDPLVLPDARLSEVARQLAALPHIGSLRLHTRLPIVLPSRVDSQLIEWISDFPGRLVIVVHCNHPNEIDAGVQRALQRLSRAGVMLLNQSVLLQGVNDAAETLIRLGESLFAAGVLPYYLHLLDRVQGAAHFEVNAARAARLMEAVHATLPGYLVPRLVRDIPGYPGKWPAWPAGQPAGTH
jgi:EF-P beta-lysylation protein EpmB